MLKEGPIRKIAKNFALITVIFVAVLSTYINGTKAVSATYGVSTKEQWDAGTLTGANSYTTPGDIKISSEGSWGARTWKTPPNTFGVGSAFTADSNYTYALRGAYGADFYKYDSTTNTWTELTDAPLSAGNDASLVAGGTDTIYAIFGRSTKKFYKYTPSTNAWTELADTPDTTLAGSSIVYANNKVYLIRSGGTQDFWVYDLATQGWSSITGLPAAPNSVNASATDGSYIYAFRGRSTTTVYRYDIAAGTWATMTTVLSLAVAEQTQLSYHDGSLYMVRPNTTVFQKCEISGLACVGNAWSTLATLPATSRYASVQYNPKDGYMYVFRGNATYDFWKYDIGTNSFLGKTDFPQTLSTGADLIWDGGNYVYGLRGASATNGFYYLDLTTNTWAARTTTGLPTLSYDTKAVRAGDFIYVFRGNSNNFYAYDTKADASGWTEKAVAPGVISNGGSLIYPGSGDYIYATRGNNFGAFYAYSISNNNWTALDPADIPTPDVVNIGGRLATDGTDIYAVMGSGSSTFLKYDVSENSWSELTRTPFSPYYGTDLAYYNGKIYATAGNYRSDFFEYNIGENTWRELESFQPKTRNENGASAGASLEYIGSSTFMFARAQGQTELLTYTAGSHDYQASATYESPAIDLSYVDAWQSLSIESTKPTGTDVIVKTRTSSDSTTWSSYAPLSSGNVVSDKARYLQVEITLESNDDQTKTPSVRSYTVTYSPDEQDPNNPAACNGYSEKNGQAINQTATYRHDHPYFEWSGATDAKTQVAGYYVYFGNSSSADPYTSGSYQTSSNYTVNTAISVGNNYLLIKTKDSAGNVSDSAYQAFTYKYNGAGAQSRTITTSEEFQSGSVDKVTVNEDLDQIALQAKNGFWNQTRLSAAASTFGAGASVVYKASTNKLYVARGSNTVTFWEYNISTDVWTALSTTGLGTINYGGGLADGPGNYIYAMRGGLSGSFYRYNIANDAAGWSDTDAADAPLPFGYGGSMVYDGSRYIYAIKGNTSNTFYRFDTSAESGGQWTTLGAVDFGPTAPNNNIADGGTLAYDGDDTVYATLGSTYTNIAKYSISNSTWTPMEPLPNTAPTGASLSWDEVSGKLYFLSGGSTEKFYGYDPDDDEWTNLSSLPMVATTGAFLQPAGDYIYASRGGSTNLYRYTVSKNSWEVPTFNLFGPNWQGTSTFSVNSGGVMAYAEDDTFYMMRGNFDNKIVKYDSGTGVAEEIPNPPIGITTGAALAYDDDRDVLYLISGIGNELYFFKYSVSDNAWSADTSDALPASSSYGAALAYDGSQYVYYARGGNTTSWYRYNVTADAGSRWSTALPATGTAGFGYGSQLKIKNGYAYALRGQVANPNPFYRFKLSDLPGGSWETLSSLGTAVGYDGILVDGGDDKLYAANANNTSTFWEYDISENTWTAASSFPGQIYQGGAGASDKLEKILAIAGTGTNTYSDGLYSYIIKSDSTSFEQSGSYTSQALDLTSVYEWANLSVTYTLPANTTVTIETQSSSNGTDWSALTAVSGNKAVGNTHEFAINSPVARYLKVKISMISGDNIYTPTLTDYTVNYYQDNAKPSNPTALSSAKSVKTGGVDMTGGHWGNYSTPYFSWPTEDAENGASDGVNGSGVSGYYIYFGTSSTADPSLTRGIATQLGETGKRLQTDNDFEVSVDSSAIETGKTYYLITKTKDGAGNVVDSSKTLFVYKFDSTTPSAPTTINSVQNEAKTQFTFTWPAVGEENGAIDPDPDPVDSAISPSVVNGYQYKTAATSGDYSNWSSDMTETEIVLDNSKNPAGENTFYLRSRDTAGNYSEAETINFYIAPTAPENLAGEPATSESSPATTNNFKFTWSAPSGIEGAIKQYRYSINTPPTATNTLEQTTTHTYLDWDDYAKQQGKNTLYVVAEGDWGGSNVNYNTYASIDFFVQTSAPNPPTKLALVDSSNRVSGDYRLTLTWQAPQDNENVTEYVVEKSTDNATFAQIGTTSSTGFLDSNLTGDTTYYYKVFSKDSAGALSADQGAAGTVSKKPTGKYTTAPAVLESSIEVIAGANSAEISWITDRESDSFVEYGTSEQFGSSYGQRDEVKEHTVKLTGLSAGSKYYFRAQSLDPGDLRDYSQSSGYSETHEFSTTAAPALSNVAFTDITTNSAVLSFETNKASSSLIEYGISTSYGISVTDDSGGGTTKHAMRISDLQDDTVYQMKITIVDEEGNIVISPGHAFRTLAKPRIENIKVDPLPEEAETTVRVSWVTNVETTGAVVYYSDSEAQKELASSEFKTEHEFKISGLKDQSIYKIKAIGRDKFGNEIISSENSFSTPSDSRPPIISDIVIETSNVGGDKEDESQVVVSWKTDEPATSKVEYGEGASGESYTSSSTEDPTMTNSHLVIISGLKSSTPYHLRAVSTDKGDNVTNSADNTVIPGEVQKSVLSIILKAFQNAFGWLGNII